MVFQAKHGSKSVRHKHAGLSLVELLIVITIIGILVALLLPAVQAARESARKMQCANNIKQLAMAALCHESSLRFFPTGGWYEDWLGHPDRGFEKNQPGGWIYNVLPFLDQQALHDLGKSGSGITIQRANVIRITTPLLIMNCPSRRRTILYPLHNGIYGIQFHLTDSVITPLARSDYAINGGDYYRGRLTESPRNLDVADARIEAQWDDTSMQTGISHQRSQVTMANIEDGTTCTFLIGEKHIDVSRYTDGNDPGDTTTMYGGGDLELIRWTRKMGNTIAFPRQDNMKIGNGDHGYWFGSAHPSGLSMSLCDGSVRMISYSIDGEVYRRLGNRKDCLPVDGSRF